MPNLSATTDSNSSKPFVWIFVALFILLGVGYVAAKSVFGANRTVTTVGVGRQAVAANKARVVFTYAATNPDRTVAQNQGQEQFTQLLNQLKQFSPQTLVKTPESIAGISNSSGDISAYRYVIGASLTLSGRDQIMSAIDLLNQRQANIVSVSYLPEDELTAGQEARQQAIADARTKAEQIAKASKARVGKVITVTEQGSNSQSGSAITSAQTSTDTYTQSSFDQVEVSSILTVQFELK